MQALDVVRVLAGLILLVAGGQTLVRGAGALAVRLGLSPLVVGLTVVSVATSAPELAVTLRALTSGDIALALGNVVGSNIVNILLVLGVTALVSAVVVAPGLLRMDLPIVVALSLLMLVLALDGTIGALDGAMLLTCFGAAMWLAVRRGRRDPAPAAGDGPATMGGGRAALFVVGGVALLVAGASLLVDGAVAIAAAFGVSQLIIGLTVVAVGTSLPEVAACVSAALRGETDLAVGNVLGSNIANMGLVLGVPALLGGGVPVPAAAVALDIPFMLASVVVLVPIALTDRRIHRAEGAVLVLLYAAYTAYVLLDATGHDALHGFTRVMVAFVAPLLAAGLLGHTMWSWGRDRRGASVQEGGP
ncbi:MAG: calcium/sodium antiporter [Tetrasphaera sp.]